MKLLTFKILFLLPLTILIFSQSDTFSDSGPLTIENHCSQDPTLLHFYTDLFDPPYCGAYAAKQMGLGQSNQIVFQKGEYQQTLVDVPYTGCHFHLQQQGQVGFPPPLDVRRDVVCNDLGGVCVCANKGMQQKKTPSVLKKNVHQNEQTPPK